MAGYSNKPVMQWSQDSLHFTCWAISYLCDVDKLNLIYDRTWRSTEYASIIEFPPTTPTSY